MLVSSPCVGLCQLDDDRCVGCGRTLDEIAGWGTMSEMERQDVMAGLPDRVPATELRAASQSDPSET